MKHMIKHKEYTSEMKVDREKSKIYEEMYKRAYNIRENAYAKYSNFKVGACILTDDGRMFEGVNMENSSYGVTICAERAALLNGITNGARKFKAIAVAGGDEKDGCTWPCGICRQALYEFGGDLDVITCDEKGSLQVLKLDELLVNGFKMKD